MNDIRILYMLPTAAIVLVGGLACKAFELNYWWMGVPAIVSFVVGGLMILAQSLWVP